VAQLTLGGEFDWTRGDDDLLLKLAPCIQKIVIKYAHEHNLKPQEAWNNLRARDIEDDSRERRRQFAP
jgi:hypothetical protein